MHVLTLIDCVLFSDVGLRDGEEKRKEYERWGGDRC